MNYSLKALAGFEKDIKRLSKKYKSFKTDLLKLRVQLLNNPKSGIPLGNSCYKVRFSITSKNKGKSGGARVITHLLLVNDEEGIIYLLALYDKSDQETISDKQITELLKQII